MVDRNEVLRYLGYRGQDIDNELEVLINICREETALKSKPRYIYGYFSLEQRDDGIEIENTTLVLKGEDIKKHLNNCDKCAILIATLGAEIEKEIILNEKINLTKSIILDACSTTYIEEVCDKVEEDIRQEMKGEGLHITSRFSPGYGDLSLDIQRDLLLVMDANKRIGLNVSKHNILFPRKSVTAIIGITKEEIIEGKRKCSDCNKFESCIYRKGGQSCGN